MSYLERKFETLWRYSGCADDYRKGFYELQVQYNKPKRYYHTFEGHIRFCVYNFLEYVIDRVKNPINVLWQLILHDSVMDFGRSDEVNCEAREYVPGYNDAMSAQYAGEFLSKYDVDVEIINSVAKAIVYYDHKSVPDDDDVKTGLDIDLLILAQSQDVFDEYENNIRKEYLWVKEDIFRKKRIEILISFLNNRPRIFLTDYLYDQYEDQARVNIERSIDKLMI